MPRFPMHFPQDGINTFHAPTEADWRAWLEANHATAPSVWLIFYKKNSGTPSVYYSEAVDQAICFGWIDSVIKKRDADSYYQFYTKRSPKSFWSRVNKLKVERLEKAGLIAEKGWASIRLAQQNGTWTALDGVENLEIPPDLAAALEQDALAKAGFELLARSTKRNSLENLLHAKGIATRQKRIAKILEVARARAEKAK